MAYLLKIKKNIEEQDINEFKLKKEKYLERRKQKREIRDAAEDYDPPKDGAPETHAPAVLQKFGDSNEAASVRFAESMGTFSVRGTDQNVRCEFIRKQLNLMRTIVRAKPVLLVISEDGVKITDKRGLSLIQAHAIHRISYCTCIPKEKLFCFLARQPRGPVDVQFCHVFTCPTSDQVEELNLLLSNAFKTAQVKKKITEQFNLRIADKLEEQRELYQQVQVKLEADRIKNEKLEKEGTPFIEENTEKLTEEYSWFKPKITREEALHYLLSRDVGSFLVRESGSHPGGYALTVRVPCHDNPAGVSHYLIERSAQGLKVRGLDKEWTNLPSLIIHHTILPEMLPCLLKPDQAKTTPKSTEPAANNNNMNQGVF